MAMSKEAQGYCGDEGGGGYIPSKSRPWLPDSVKREVRKRAQGHCELCGIPCPGEIHHKTYSHLYRDGDLTPADDLQLLCRDCHKASHTDPAGDFWVDPMEMEDCWFGYHWAMAKD